MVHQAASMSLKTPAGKNMAAYHVLSFTSKAALKKIADL
jgi:hypothetical protein